MTPATRWAIPNHAGTIAAGQREIRPGSRRGAIAPASARNPAPAAKRTQRARWPISVPPVVGQHPPLRIPAPSGAGRSPLAPRGTAHEGPSAEASLQPVESPSIMLLLSGFGHAIARVHLQPNLKSRKRDEKDTVGAAAHR
jgi:hypothetical protein